MGKCQVEMCLGEVAAKGLCGTHYRRMRLYGDPGKVKQQHVMGMSKYCQAGGCSKKAIAKGLCPAHYKRMRLYGNPNVVKQHQLHGLSLEERFWAYTAKSSGCWLWIGTRDRRGYGRLMLKGVPLLASRLSWHLHNGDIPLKKYVLHTCDNPSCVNPNHLYIGDQTDNMTDMWNRGRANPGRSVGEKHGMSKLTETMVREVRCGNKNLSTLAKEFGVSRTTIWQVRSRKTWRHID